jgi:hypothetical protein
MQVCDRLHNYHSDILVNLDKKGLQSCLADKNVIWSVYVTAIASMGLLQQLLQLVVIIYITALLRSIGNNYLLQMESRRRKVNLLSSKLGGIRESYALFSSSLSFKISCLYKNNKKNHINLFSKKLIKSINYVPYIIFQAKL